MTETQPKRRGRPPKARDVVRDSPPEPASRPRGAIEAPPAPTKAEGFLWLVPLAGDADVDELRRHEISIRERIFRAESSIAHHVFLLQRIHAQLAEAGEEPFPYWRSKFSPWGDGDRLEDLRPYFHFER